MQKCKDMGVVHMFESVVLQHRESKQKPGFKES